MDKLAEFLTYLERELYRSTHTSSAYGRDIGQFLEWLGSGNTDPSMADSLDIRRWLGARASLGDSSTTLRRKTESLRAFFNFLKRRGYIEENPAGPIILPKIPKPLPDFVKTQDMEATLSTEPEISDDNLSGVREHLVIHLLYATGLRRAEILSLTDNSLISGNDGTVSLKVLGKRNKERMVPIAAELHDEIRRWQALRDREYPELKRPRPILATSRGLMSISTLERIVKKMLSGIPAGRRSPHTLRHTFATSMLNAGADLGAVKEILGHASLATTQIYTHLNFSDIEKVYRQAHPREKKPGDE